jgi:hypothetical protein
MSTQISTLRERLLHVADPTATRELSDRVRNAISRVEIVAGEASAERGSHLTDAPDPDPLVRALRRVSHDLTMVNRATVMPLAEPACRLMAPATRASTEIAAFLHAASVVITNGPKTLSIEMARNALDEFAAVLESYRYDPPEDHLHREAIIQPFGLAFALEELRRHLAELADRVSEFAHLVPGGGRS